jgi:hypothetical protein
MGSLIRPAAPNPLASRTGPQSMDGTVTPRKTAALPSPSSRKAFFLLTVLRALFTREACVHPLRALL